MSTEQCSLQRFDELAPSHLLIGAVFDAELLLFDVVSDEKIPHVNVTGFLSTRILLVPLHKYVNLVILVYNMLVHLVTMTP